MVYYCRRGRGFNVLGATNISAEGARALAEAADGVWSSILARDIDGLGRWYRASFEAQVAMFPLMKSRVWCYKKLNGYAKAIAMLT